MDPVTLGAAKAAAVSIAGARNAASLMNAMSAGVRNCVILNLGDSTSVVNPNNSWVLQVAQWLATRFPAYTVNYRVFNSTNQNYDALGTTNSSRVVQAGTGTGNAGGPFVLDIYNGGVTGVTASYPLATANRLAAMIPATPDLVFVNYGHNSTTQTTAYRQTSYPTTRVIRELYPTAGIILIGQNPRGVGDTEAAADYYRSRVVGELASSEGYGFVDVTSAFLATANYSSALVQGDKLHQTVAGDNLWAAMVQRLLASAAGQVPLTPKVDATQAFLPAAAMYASIGTPTLSNANGVPVWSMPNGSDTEVGGTLSIPSHWQFFDLYLIWTHPSASFSAGSNAIAVRSRTGHISLGRTAVSLGGGWSNPVFSTNQGSDVIALAPTGVTTAYSSIGVLLVSAVQVVGNPVRVQIKRAGTNASDTLASPALFLGAYLTRAA